MSNALKILENIVGPTTIGMLIRAYRTRNELNVTQLAKILGVTKSYVSDIENDRKTVSLYQARVFAEKLGDSVALFAKVWMEQRLREAEIEASVVVKPIKKGLTLEHGKARKVYEIKDLPHVFAKKATRRVSGGAKFMAKAHAPKKKSIKKVG